MINRAYRIFYEYKGPTKSDPFRDPKSPEQVQEALDRFPDELETSFFEQQEFRAFVEEGNSQNERTIRFIVSADEEEFETALKRILNCNDLFAERLE
jgi:hypothetical protein